jgi:hypothetical protein
MKNKNIFIVALILFLSQSLFAQVFDKEPVKDTTWAKWNFLIGNWEGDGNGKPGKGNGAFSFKTDLDDNILVRKSSTIFPKTQDKAVLVHDDLLIIYPDTTGIPSKAIYFDNEGHVLNYTITYTDSSIVLTSDVVPDLARFRLSYIKIDSKKVNVRFEMALPPEQNKFMTYIEEKATKKD